MIGLAERFLQALFLVGKQRWHSQLGYRERAPRHIQRELQERAKARRSARQAKRLAWQAEYNATYYRATQLPGWFALDFKWRDVIDSCREWSRQQEEQII